MIVRGFRGGCGWDLGGGLAGVWVGLGEVWVGVGLAGVWLGFGWSLGGGG